MVGIEQNRSNIAVLTRVITAINGPRIVNMPPDTHKGCILHVQTYLPGYPLLENAYIDQNRQKMAHKCPF